MPGSIWSVNSGWQSALFISCLSPGSGTLRLLRLKTLATGKYLGKKHQLQKTNSGTSIKSITNSTLIVLHAHDWTHKEAKVATRNKLGCFGMQNVGLNASPLSMHYSIKPHQSFYGGLWAHPSSSSRDGGVEEEREGKGRKWYREGWRDGWGGGECGAVAAGMLQDRTWRVIRGERPEKRWCVEIEAPAGTQSLA